MSGSSVERALSCEDALQGLDARQVAKIERASYVWNTLGGLVNAFQSVIMLMVLMRVSTPAVAGVFTIAYANANLFLNLGKYGMRSFQVSDVRQAYTFGAYLRSRVITTAAMVVVSCAYLAFSAVTLDYSADKVLVVLVMGLFKAVDAVEDVYFGNFQQVGRLDVAGRLVTARVASSIVVFGVGVVLSGDLLAPLAIATVYTALFLVAALAYARRRYDLPRGDRRIAPGSVADLLKTCFPLFLAAFLLFYIGNAPKYAIDACLGDVEQAYYGFIAMPVFIVGLLASFVYNPIITPMSRFWDEGRAGEFLRMFLVQVGVVIAITAVCDLGAYLIGLPVLGWLYNADLSPYLAELLVLVSGGGLYALTTLFTLGITIMRNQRQLVWGYVLVAMAAMVVSNPVASRWGIAGASWEYFVLMAALSLCFGIIFAVGFARASRKRGRHCSR